jgi:hypothetical protein
VPDYQLKTTTMKISNLTLITAVSVFVMMGCNPNDRNKKLNGSSDTTATFKAGSGVQPDTNTINDQRKAAKQDTLKGDTNANGNADPSGRASKSNH